MKKNTSGVDYYGVVDDYGFDWEKGNFIFTSQDPIECAEWMEDNNYHSASLVAVYRDGERVKDN